jgi:hypothetical protein
LEARLIEATVVEDGRLARITVAITITVTVTVTVAITVTTRVAIDRGVGAAVPSIARAIASQRRASAGKDEQHYAQR